MRTSSGSYPDSGYRFYTDFPTFSEAVIYGNKLDRDGAELIELGELFNRCLPIDVLLRMPRKFISRLRELRRYQKKRQSEQHQMQINNAQNNMAHNNAINYANNALNSTAIGELVDELS